MKKIVLTFGVLAGVIVSLMMFLTIPMYNNGMLKLNNGEIVGYTTMVIAMSMVFFGVKSYRNRHLNGKITFGLALQVGLLIAAVASVMYVIAWEIELHFFFPDFLEMYGRLMIKNATENGASPARLQEIQDQMIQMEGFYKNMFLRMLITFLEIFPVGLVVALISAAALRRKEFLPA